MAIWIYDLLSQNFKIPINKFWLGLIATYELCILVCFDIWQL